MRMKQINILRDIYLSLNPNATAKEFARYVKIAKWSLATSKGASNA